MASNGHVRLLPITIMVDGKFFDAASYKANPVPMALDFGVVYEGFRTGVSQGTFTITQPGQLAHSWVAEGTWLATGAKPPQKSLKAEMPNIEEKDAPPTLKRGSPKKDSPPDTTKPPSSTPGEAPKTSPPAPPPANDSKPAPPPAPEAKSEPVAPATIDDPNRPTLRRGKPDPNAAHDLKTFDDEPGSSAGVKPNSAKSANAKATEPKAEQAQLIPAISDTGGPDARSYAYEMKPEEEAEYRKKMLDLATTELQRKQKPVGPPSKSGSRKSAAPKQPAVPFENVRLKVFDLSSANEPILILSATVPPAANSGDSALPQEITLVARTNLQLDVHKLFFSVTDDKHLDIYPRMELIDAVDADGDGRGELLFRRVFDNGSAYAIYRAAADQLWPLWEPTP
jgi:hypothetical protein